MRKSKRKTSCKCNFSISTEDSTETICWSGFADLLTLLLQLLTYDCREEEKDNLSGLEEEEESEEIPVKKA